MLEFFGGGLCCVGLEVMAIVILIVWLYLSDYAKGPLD